jgi:hypothetical protein
MLHVNNSIDPVENAFARDAVSGLSADVKSRWLYDERGSLRPRHRRWRPRRRGAVPRSCRNRRPVACASVVSLPGWASSGRGSGRAVRPGVWIAAGAWRFRSVATRREKSNREVPFHVFLRGPTPRVLRTPRRLIADGRDAGAHSALRRRYLMPIECMSKGNF